MGSDWIFGTLAGGCGVDSFGSVYGAVVGSCECGDELCVLTPWDLFVCYINKSSHVRLPSCLYACPLSTLNHSVTFMKFSMKVMTLKVITTP
jgi:hypothetical protein